MMAAESTGRPDSWRASGCRNFDADDLGEWVDAAEQHLCEFAGTLRVPGERRQLRWGALKINSAECPGYDGSLQDGFGAAVEVSIAVGRQRAWMAVVGPASTMKMNPTKLAAAATKKAIR